MTSDGVVATWWERLVNPGELGRPVRWSILVTWTLITAALVWRHEPWRDEADAWLAARDLPVAELTRFTSCAGTPALWYFLIAPLARSGMPYFSMFILHGALAGIVVGLLLRANAVPKLVRVLLPFSPLFLFEYSVVARSYVLTVLLLIVAGHLHEGPGRRPVLLGLVIGLLSNTNAHGLFLAIGVGVALVAEQRGRLRTSRPHALGMLLALALGTLAVIQLLPHPDRQVLPPLEAEPVSIARRIVRAFGGGFMPEVPAPWKAGGLLVLPFVALALTRRPAVLLGFLVAMAGLMFVFTRAHAGELRHHGLLQGLAVWGLMAGQRATAGWAAGNVDRPIDADPSARGRVWSPMALAWVATTAISLPFSARLLALEVNEKHSAASETAEFMLQHGLDRTGTIAAHQASTCSAVLPYLGVRTFWYPGIEGRGSHMRWDRAYTNGEEVPFEEAARRARAHLPSGSLLLTSRPLQGVEGVDLLFESSSPGFRHADERYWLYRLNPGRPVADEAAAERRAAREGLKRDR